MVVDACTSGLDMKEHIITRTTSTLIRMATVWVAAVRPRSALVPRSFHVRFTLVPGSTLVPHSFHTVLRTFYARSGNPQYMAKPVQYLHCLWDFKGWTEKAMKISPISRLCRGNVQDKEGAYSGMYDFLFGDRGGTGFARLKYREHCTHPWLPSLSMGAEVITALPPHLVSISR